MKKWIAVGLAALSFWAVGTAVSPECGFARSSRTTKINQDETRTRGRALKPGDCIGILAPASTWDKPDCRVSVRTPGINTISYSIP